MPNPLKTSFCPEIIMMNCLPAASYMYFAESFEQIPVIRQPKSSELLCRRGCPGTGGGTTAACLHRSSVKFNAK